METKQFYTFNIEGLTDAQLKFLAECEKQFFDNEVIDLEFLKKAFYNSGFKNGCPEAKEVLEAWDYFKGMPKPIYRNSLKEPLKLSQLFEVNEHGENTLYSKNGWGNKVKGDLYTDVKDKIVPNLVKTEDYYFHLSDNKKRLYLKYNSIIGNRYIADVIDDIFID